MQNNNTTYTFLKNTTFSQLRLWDVKGYLRNTLIKKEGYILLKDIITPVRKMVNKKDVIANGWQIISKINFGGQLFLRDFEEIKSYKGNLSLISKNDIIFSKINARHGCIYFHNSVTPFCVSSEYPAFAVDTKKANGFFLQMLLRSNKVKEHLNAKVTGISKARIKSDEFLNISFPLPSLYEQNKIVESFQQKLKVADGIEKEIKNIKSEIETYLNKELGIVLNEKIIRKGLQCISYTQVEKWGYENLNRYISIIRGKYHTEKIGNICTISSGGTPSRSKKEYYTGNIPWIKTGEVVNDEIFDSEEKITEQAIQNSSAKIFPKGSLIIAMYGQGATRGRTAKLGIDASTNQACAVLYDFHNDKVLTDYVWIYLMNEYERLRSLASGNNQPNLNAGMIFNYPIQIPPMEIQESIISYFFGNVRNMKLLKQEAEQVRIKALQEFENKIFNYGD